MGSLRLGGPVLTVPSWDLDCPVSPPSWVPGLSALRWGGEGSALPPL